MRILVVEDHAQTGKLFARLLRLRGHQAEHAASAAEAVDLCAAGPFDLILCDIGLPDMSGWELVRILHQHCPDVPAIALSGYGQEEDVRRSRDAGFVEHLLKPVTLEVLDEAITRFAKAPTPPP